MVEKSSTRRPSKLRVKFPSSSAAIVVGKASSSFVIPWRGVDPKVSRPDRKASRPDRARGRSCILLKGRLDPILHGPCHGLERGRLLKVLFVTTEMDDFVRVGGLAAVSAALPRALRPWSDVRIMLPGYRDVVEQFTHIEIVGQCPAHAEMPACTLGRASTKDGLPVYVLLCPQLYDRPGNPYGDESGRDLSLIHI